MPRLADTQRDFLNALMGAQDDAPRILASVRALGVQEAQRFEVYRNNVFSNYRAALQALYPVIERLVGKAFFRHACNRYIKEHASASGDLHDYGANLAQFLQDYAPAAQLPYLPDVARLEWLYHSVFHAAEHAALDLVRLAGVDPESYVKLRFQLHPASALMRSRYPVLRIWRVNQPDYEGEISADWDAGGDDLLVTREADYSVKIAKLTPVEYAFLSTLARGEHLARALDTMRALSTDFDLQATLAKFIQWHVIVDFALD